MRMDQSQPDKPDGKAAMVTALKVEDSGDTASLIRTRGGTREGEPIKLFRARNEDGRKKKKGPRLGQR